METIKRLYIGGISPLVTKAELACRFGKFGKINDVEIIHRKDEQGNPIKTFAYLNVSITDVNLKNCISVLNKTKWKGGILQIEIAKQSFLNRLSQERREAKEKVIAQPKLQNDLVLSLEKAGVADFQMKVAVPGTEVPNHKNWVVSKFGRVLPVLHFNRKKQSKIMKYDPSKYCHNIKKIEGNFELVPVSQLTWQLEGGENEIRGKRRGSFLNPMPSPRKKFINLPVSGNNNTETDQRMPLAFAKTAERQPAQKLPLHRKKLGHLRNRCNNRMTDEYDFEEEPRAVLEEREAVIYAEDSNVEVGDDSFEASCTTYWIEQKAAQKMDTTCNTLGDSEYDSVDIDEIIKVTKTIQKSGDNLKTKKLKTVRRDTFTQLKIKGVKQGSTYACGTKDHCRSKDHEISKCELDSETDTSEDEGSDFYLDEEYKAMTHNCFRIDLTMGNLEALAKEVDEFNNHDAENDGKYHMDDILNIQQGYSEIPLDSGSEMLPASEKPLNTGQALAGIKKHLKSENVQSRVLNSDRQSTSDELDSSGLDTLYDSINTGNVKIEVLSHKSPTKMQSLNNHELQIGAKGPIGETNKSKQDPLFAHVKSLHKRGTIEPDDIVATILEDDSRAPQSNQKKKKYEVKPPAFKGLCSVLASVATGNSLSAMSIVKSAAVKTISNDLNVSSFASEETKKAEIKEQFRCLKQIFLEAKSKSGSDRSNTRNEGNSDFSPLSSLAAKDGISQIGPMEQTTFNVKQQQDNQKRLLAMMEWRKERELQKQVIQSALLQLDSQSSKNSQHIVFNSESDSEKEETSHEKQIMHAEKFTNKGTSMLFSTSEEDSDEGQKDNERFEIKAQYEGKSGMKLMQLQSRFGTDERFRMDSRFLESSSEDEEASELCKSTVDEYDSFAEKKKNLGILQSILDIHVKPQSTGKQTAKGKKFKDLNAFHYDPGKEDHATFETKEKKESKSERTKKRLEAEKLPDVSKETYHEIIMDFQEVFGVSKFQNKPEKTWDQELEPEKKEADMNLSVELLSLQNKNTEEQVKFTFSFFGNTERSSLNNELYKSETIKPAKVAWQEDSRFNDSSSEEEDKKNATVATKKKISLRPDITTTRSFFFVKDDERLKTGPKMFCQSSNTEEEAWEQRQDILLEECRKRHKDAKRKFKAKMED